ncbi:MAG: hypothetical protein QOI08_4405, partial [Actinomycetota bacterium]|nr:hypothetical protein [Actinomycetota bacterium]
MLAYDSDGKSNIDIEASVAS